MPRKAASQSKSPDQVSPTSDTMPIQTIIDYRAKGLTLDEIGKIAGVTKQSIHSRIKAYDKHIESLEHFKKHRGDILSVTQSRIINSITDEDIQKSSAYQRVGMFGILYDKERLERDKSTHNLAIDYQRNINDIDKEIEALEAEIGLQDGQAVTDYMDTVDDYTAQVDQLLSIEASIQGSVPVESTVGSIDQSTEGVGGQK